MLECPNCRYKGGFFGRVFKKAKSGNRACVKCNAEVRFKQESLRKILLVSVGMCIFGLLFTAIQLLNIGDFPVRLILGFVLGAILSWLGRLLSIKPELAIVGEWAGKSKEGENVAFDFKEDRTVFWTIDPTKPGGTIRAKYKIDYSPTPIQLDIFDFDVPQLNGYRFLGILEFRPKNKMLFNWRPIKGSEGDRPAELAEGTIELSRIKK